MILDRLESFDGTILKVSQSDIELRPYVICDH